MSIRQKLILGLAGISLLVVVVGAFAVVNNNYIQRNVTNLRNSTIELNENSTHMSIALLMSQKGAQELLAQSWRGGFAGQEATDAQTARAAAAAAIAQDLSNFETAWSATRKITEDDLEVARERQDIEEIQQETEEIENLQRINAAFIEYKQHSDRFIVLVGADLRDADQYLEETLEPQYETELLPLVQAHKSALERELASQSVAISNAVFRVSRILIGSTITALLLAALLGFFISHSIHNPIKNLQAAAMEFGSGNLDSRIAISARDELGALAVAFNKMAENLQKTTVSKK